MRDSSLTGLRRKRQQEKADTMNTEPQTHAETQTAPNILKMKIQVATLRTVLTAVSGLTDEVKLQVTPDGLYLKAVDTAHVAMVELTLGKRAFYEYKATTQEMGIDLIKLKAILKLAKPKDFAEVTREGGNLTLMVNNMKHGITLQDTANMGDPKVPNLSLPNKVSLLSSDLVTAIKAAANISDHVTLTAEGNTFEIIAEGDSDKMHMTLKGDQLIRIQAQDKTRSKFSLDYFAIILKAIGKSDPINLDLGTDYPTRISYDIAEGAGHITYILAPQI